jgi:hypothetical protein
MLSLSKYKDTLHRTRKMTLKFYRTAKVPHSQSNLEQKEQSRRCYTTQLQNILQKPSMKKCGICIETDQGNRVESLEVNPCVYSQMLLNKGAKNIRGERTVFNNWCWENWISTCINMRLDLYLSPATKINSKWIEGLLNEIPATIKLSGENREEKQSHNEISAI